MAAILHAYVVYPWLIVWMARRGQGRIAPPFSFSATNCPRVSVLISAYNAETSIRERIQNLVACDYPTDRMKILIASDGSTDRTVENARDSHAPNLTVLDFKDRRGKTATLIRSMAMIDSDVVIFSDATSHFSADAIRNLSRHFEDPSVGIVSGSIRMLTETGVNAEGLYWKIESTVRRSEAKLGVVTGVSGAIYAIRRSMFVEPTRPTINDDMLFPILAKHKHRCKFVFDEAAIAEVIVPQGMLTEFRRRRRIGLGALQSLPLLFPVLWASDGLSAFALFSHKILRWAVPFALIVLLVSNLLLLGSMAFQAILAIQLLSFCAALLGLIRASSKAWIRWFAVATSFYMMNFALAIGFLDWLFASQNVVWEPTQRPKRSTYLSDKPLT